MKKWMIIVGVIVILVIGVVLYGLFMSPVKGQTKCAGFGCGGPPQKCSTLQDTTCKAQCDDATERKIDGPLCETENFVCCQLKLYALK